MREVHEAIGRSKAVACTTTLKQMQVMHQKGLLSRTERFRSQVCRPRQPQTKVQKKLAQSLLDRAFGGSARGLRARHPLAFCRRTEGERRVHTRTASPGDWRAKRIIELGC